MLARARYRATGSWAALAWVAVGAIAFILGRSSVADPFLTVSILAALGIGWLVAARKLTALIPLAMLALAWGTSTLPLTAFAFPVKFAMLGAIAATTIAWLVSREPHLPISVPFTIAFGGLLLFATMSIGWSVDPGESGPKALSLALLGAAALVAVPLNCRDERDARAILRWSGVTAAAFTVAGLAAGLAEVVAAFDGHARFLGLLNNPNALGFWIAPILPALVIMSTQEPAGVRRKTLIASTLVLAAGLALTGSRGGTLASVGGVTVALLASGLGGQGRSRRILVVGIVAFAAAAFIFPALGVTLRSSTNANAEGFFELGSGSGRTVVWGEAIPLINGAPLLGHGFGTTPSIFPEIQERFGVTVLGRTHNSYLEAAVDLGWPGLLILVTLIASGIVIAWRIARHPGPHSGFATVLLAAIVGGAIEGIFESGALAAGSLFALPFWIVLALAHSLRAEVRKGDQVTAAS